ncbi:low molecular weight phosphatase family protein [Streptomyces sioyaensis]|uniref:arsenate reductase/protein-tyrosine-phosphatase family protein n=1 Tax=Streptomyces sioyaensis TaxID=67364 RepID=UPI0033DAD015
MTQEPTSPTILFICTGNVYRSPLAERLLASRIKHAQVWSAGTEAVRITGMHPDARSILEELGGNGEGFTSRILREEYVANAELVLGLEEQHREAAVRLSPKSLRKCFTLKEFLRLAGGSTSPLRDPITEAAARRGSAPPVPRSEDEIADPLGSSYRTLRTCAHEVAESVAQLSELLKRR